MDRDDTIKILTLIKGNWYRQPADALTVEMWKSILGPQLQLQDVWLVAIRMIHEPRLEPPTPGELYAAALPEMRARIVREQKSLKRLGDVPKWQPGERRMTPDGRLFIADENGIPRKTVEN